MSLRVDMLKKRLAAAPGKDKALHRAAVNRAIRALNRLVSQWRETRSAGTGSEARFSEKDDALAQIRAQLKAMGLDDAMIEATIQAAMQQMQSAQQQAQQPTQSGVPVPATEAEWAAFEPALRQDVEKIWRRAAMYAVLPAGVRSFIAGLYKDIVGTGLVALGKQSGMSLADIAPLKAFERDRYIDYIPRQRGFERVILPLSEQDQEAPVARLLRGYLTQTLRRAGITAPFEIVMFDSPAAVAGYTMWHTRDEMGAYFARGEFPPVVFGVSVTQLSLAAMLMTKPTWFGRGAPKMRHDAITGTAVHELAHIADNLLGYFGDHGVLDLAPGVDIPLRSLAPDAANRAAMKSLDDDMLWHFIAGQKGRGRMLFAYPMDKRYGQSARNRAIRTTEIFAQSRAGTLLLPEWVADSPDSTRQYSDTIQELEKHTGFRFSEKKGQRDADINDVGFAHTGTRRDGEHKLGGFGARNPARSLEPGNRAGDGSGRDRLSRAGAGTATTVFAGARSRAGQRERVPGAAPFPEAQSQRASGRPVEGNRSAAATATRRTAADVQRELEQAKPWFRHLEKQGLLRIVDTPADAAKFLGASPRDIARLSGAQGFTREGDALVVLVAENLDPGAAESVLMHEAFHAWLQRARGGKAHARVMENLGGIHDRLEHSEWVQKALARVSPKDRDNREVVLEEMAAYAIEQYLDERRGPRSLPRQVLRWMADVFSWVKTSLLELGVPVGNLTPRDLAAIARYGLLKELALRNPRLEVLAPGAGPQPPGGGGSTAARQGVRFSFVGERGPMTDDMKTSLARAKEAYARAGIANMDDEVLAWERADDIRRETGWLLGGDGQWRFEVSDHDAVVRRDQIGKAKTLGELLEHPALYALAPVLEYIGVTWDAADGTYYTRHGLPRINLPPKTPPGELRASLLHEVQHVLQDMSDLDSGTNPEKIDRRIDERREELDRQIGAQARQALKEAGKFVKPGSPEYIRHIAATRERKAELQKAMSMFRFLTRYGGPLAFDLYRRKGGEVEARNVAARRDMTPEERRKTPPSYTQDTNVDGVWYGDPGGLKFSERADPAREAFEALAQHDEAFQYRKPKGDTLKGVMAEIDPGYTVKRLPPELNAHGSRAVWEIVSPNGGAAQIYRRDREVWLDVSNFRPGADAGSKVYAAVAGYAMNTGRVFIGDPSGLTQTGFFRRLENMISTTLRYGTTDHIRPHEYQIHPEAQWGAAFKDFAIDWKEGDTAHNLTEMLRASYNAAVANNPEIRNVIYDARRRAFVDTRRGRVLTRDDLAQRTQRASGRSPAGYTGGSTTAARAALYNTLLQGPGGTVGADLVGALRNGLSGPINEATRGILYSEKGHAQPLSAKVLTPTGYRRMGDLKPGDEVLTPKGTVARIKAIHPQGVQSVFRVKTNDGGETRATADHLWNINGEVVRTSWMRQVMDVATLRLPGAPRVRR
jgi:hypothetical protein